MSRSSSSTEGGVPLPAVATNLRRPCKFYFSRGFCLKGNQCTYSHNLLEIGFSAAAAMELNRQWQYDKDLFARIGKDHPVEKWFTQSCAFYRRGYCDRGEFCTFIHDPSDRFVVSGTASSSSATSLDVDQSTVITPGTKTKLKILIECMYYQQGYCSRGDACRFLHSTYPGQALVDEQV
jgi:Zinc finger C-x8-C-x5-C-x3-H type (and similar)